MRCVGSPVRRLQHPVADHVFLLRLESEQCDGEERALRAVRWSGRGGGRDSLPRRPSAAGTRGRAPPDLPRGKSSSGRSRSSCRPPCRPASAAASSPRLQREGCEEGGWGGAGLVPVGVTAPAAMAPALPPAISSDPIELSPAMRDISRGDKRRYWLLLKYRLPLSSANSFFRLA